MMNTDLVMYLYTLEKEWFLEVPSDSPKCAAALNFSPRCNSVAALNPKETGIEIINVN